MLSDFCFSMIIMVTFKRQDDNSNNQQQQQYQEPMSENSMQISTPVILHHNHHHQHQQQMTKKISPSLESSKIIDGPIVIRNQPKILPSSSSSMALFEQRRRSSSTTTNSVREATFLNDLKVQNVKIQIAKEENPIDQRINLDRNISRDKIEGLNLRMADMFAIGGGGSTNQFYCSPSAQNSFIEMKSLTTPNNQSHLHPNNNIVDNDLIDNVGNNILKNNIVHHNDSNLLNSTNSNNNSDPNLDPVDGIVSLLSAIYCKILVVIGLCFPIAEVISHRIPISWYEGFYLYLYMGSILFLIFVYIFLLNRKRKPFAQFRRSISAIMVRNTIREKNNDGCTGGIGSNNDAYDATDNSIDEEHYEFDPQQQAQCGSFYLRVGAVAFGVGSMIYSGLEFGQFFELESKEHCYSFIYGFTPSSHMIFTFIQLYFIFMNSRVLIARHKLIARFGLMHMIATNICVWLHVLIQETKHQIMVMVQTNGTHEIIGSDLTNAWDHVDDVVEEISEDYLDSVGSYPALHRTNSNNNNLPSMLLSVSKTSTTTALPLMTTISTSSVESHINQIHRTVRSLNDHYIITTGHCRRSNVIGELVTDASQFLFPCTIEYSLICAAILYIMWKNISEISEKHKNSSKYSNFNKTTTFVHHRHHYQVDCAKAHKGLFTGIFLMVMCIISLILFFVFIKKHQYRNLAVLQAHIVELIIYCITAIASLIALFQVRELNYNRNRGVELDNILLIIAQSGLCIFTMFSIIGAQFINQLQNTRLVLINAFACLIQALLQSIFILDASKRKASTIDQVRRKPGREMVTFLLVCNFSMWAINTLETRRADSNPVQMSFYGFWAWTIITHVTTPLTIFYRFHSTVSLCEIWKSTYKIKSEYL
ncbi:proton channel OtopLc-like isoform X1 [Dermatophagoides pteronyssinus]|uniref:proton channel OtopLc-like isoform X1 n=2 Tax=Dermatophagoides pteronyssinus TaxID=6956 RepID=UPI003F6661A6